MAPPIKKDDQTGSPKRLAALLLLLIVIGGTLLYAARQSDSLPSFTKSDTPQVAGAETEISSPDSEYVAPEDIKPVDTPTVDEPEITYTIVATVDGDTVKADIDGKTETLRLIGVDTPETKDPRKAVQCFGQEAANYTKQNLLGKNVRLVGDDSQDTRDKYGRLLRYVFLSDGQNFNQMLVAEGYAYEYTYRTAYVYQEEFKTAQMEASAAGKGLWSAQTCSGVR